jgi:hypothetical protein
MLKSRHRLFSSINAARGARCVKPFLSNDVPQTFAIQGSWESNMTPLLLTENGLLDLSGATRIDSLQITADVK